MGRLILRYRGQGPLPADVVQAVQALPATRIVEQTSRMLLVDGPEDDVRRVVGAGPDWVIAPERSYTRPDTRPGIKR